MTPEEFDATPEAQWVPGNRYELIGGVLIVSPMAGIAERDPNDELGYLIRGYQEHHPAGTIVDATAPEQTIPTTMNRRRCDRALWIGLGRLPDVDVDIPAIVVEFVSGSRRDSVRDHETKRDEYLAVGVREYWVFDRFRDVLTVYRLGAEGPVAEVIPSGAVYRPDLLPGFELPIARVLARANRWPGRRTRPRAQGDA
jgi:Uma2 family endonuclease